jgi:hypothetical protein
MCRDTRSRSTTSALETQPGKASTAPARCTACRHPAPSRRTRPGQWNSYLIETRRATIRVNLNGTLVNEYTSDRRTTGYLALQVHSGTVQYRNPRVMSA